MSRVVIAAADGGGRGDAGLGGRDGLDAGFGANANGGGGRCVGHDLNFKQKNYFVITPVVDATAFYIIVRFFS